MEQKNILSEINYHSFRVVYLFLILISIIGLSQIVSAENPDDYIITDSTIPGDYIDSSGSDNLRDYADLPVWIKISMVSGAIISVFCALKYIPVILAGQSQANKKGNRDKIYECICANPGLISVEISELTKINTGTARYHLYLLEKNHEIVSVKTGHKIFYFQNRSLFTKEQIAGIILCRNETTKEILDVIRKKPGASNKLISDIVGIDKSTVHWHIKRLLQAGMVKIKRKGNSAKYFFVEVLS